MPGRRRRGKAKVEGLDQAEMEKLVITLEEEMFAAAEELRFEYAAKLRDEIKELRRELAALAGAALGAAGRCASSRRGERHVQEHQAAPQLRAARDR